MSATIDGADVGLGGPKQLSVWGILVAHAGSAVDRDVLIEGVWGEGATDENRRSLHTYLSNLRTLTGVDVARSGTAYVLRVDRAEIDQFAFETAVEEARSMLTTAPEEAAELLRKALGWWRGRPYANAADTPGLQAEIRRLEELRLQAVELRIEADLAAGNHGKLIPELEALVADHPLREAFRNQQMLALYRDGRQADALRAYRRAADYLAQETGLEPSPQLQDLEMRILQHDERLLVGVGQAVTQRRALLFTDIADSTRKWDAYPDAMGRALRRHDDILTSAITGARGKPFKHTGDGIFAAFESVTDAVQAAEKAQRSFANEDWGTLGELTVRMGIDYGDVDAHGDDFSGPPLNRCARIMNAAHGGQVLLSLAAQGELTRTPIEGVGVQYLGEHRLRGLSDAERIAQLVFIGLPTEFPELRAHIAGPDPTDPDSGDSIRGYELRERVGVGTFGVVYKAYQPAVGREVAVKVIRPEFANHPAFVRRFETEAKLVAQLEHPHIVPLFDFWRDQAGGYLVMQLMRGGTLRPLIGTSWSPSAALQLIRQVGSALASAHRQGVVHRDLRPANVLLDDEGNAYLGDFGIAARILDPAKPGSLSPGALRYRAPEEIQGLPADQRSDIYSLGILTHELLTAKRVDDEPRSVTDVRPDLPEALNSVIGRATAPDASDRFPSADDFLDALTAALGDLVDLPSEPPGRTEIRNPYKGLRPFLETDHGDFFGRAGLIETLSSALERHRIVTVVGPSGSGKSSAVRAGLLPRLRAGSIGGSEDWLYVTLTPGTHPFESLTRALESVATEPLGDLAQRLADSPAALAETAESILEGHGQELVLAVDQFEEVFTLVESEDDREAFLRMLAATAESTDGRVCFILTLRADFYDRPLRYEHIGPHISAGQVTVTPPTRDELIEAIEKPAAAVGLRFEPGLAARIASEVAAQPGGLPLMQYALTELVDGRDTDLLTAADYDRIGGITGALGRRAEQVYRDLPHDRRHAAREILLRLVTVDESADDTRRRAKRSELEALDIDRRAVADVVDVFGRHRLLSFDRDSATRSPTVEVAHEALLREWTSLREWIENERGNLVLGNRFRTALAEWTAADRADDYLLTGDRIAPFTQWAATASLTRPEREFFDTSRAADEKAREAARRRRRALTGVLAGATVVSLAFGAFALVQRGQARENEKAAQSAEALAEARELAASAINILDEDPELAILLTLEAIDVTPTGAEQPAEVVNALWEAVQSNRLLDVIETGYEGITVAELSADGSLLAVTATEGEAIQMYDAATRDLIWEVRRETTDDISFPHFSPDGEMLVVGVADSTSSFAQRESPGEDGLPTRLLVLDVDTGSVVHTIEYPQCLNVSLSSWSPDASHLAVVPDPDGCVREGAPSGQWVEVFGTTTWESVALLPLRGEAVPDPEFDSSGRLFVLDVWGPPTLFSPEFEFVRSYEGIRGAGDVSADGTMMVVSHLDDPFLGLFDTATGDQLDLLTPIDVRAALPVGLRFSDDDSLVLVATPGDKTLVWDVASGELVHQIPSGSSTAAVLDEATQRLYTSGEGEVRVWTLDLVAPGVEPAGDIAPANWVNGNSFASGATLGGFTSIITEESAWFVQLFDLASGELVGSPIPGAGAQFLRDDLFAFERDGLYLVHDPATGQERPLIGCETEDFKTCAATGETLIEYDVRASVDGTELAALALDGSGTLLFLDPDTGDAISTLSLQGDESHPVPNGLQGFSRHWILLHRGDSGYVLLDRTTGDELWSRVNLRASQIDPVGSTAAFNDVDGDVFVVDLETYEESSPGFSVGRVRGLAFNPDASILAIADVADVHIVDVDTGLRRQIIPIPLVSDIHWLDDDNVVFGTRDGQWATVSLATSDLVATARTSVSRTFTAQECLTYRIDPCPAG